MPRYASPRAAEFAQVHWDHLIDGAQEEAPGHDRGLTGRLTPLSVIAGTTGNATFKLNMSPMVTLAVSITRKLT